MSSNNCTDVPLRLIDDPREILRPVDFRSIEYLELRQSIAVSGVLNSVLVRPIGERYELVDGMHRLEICRQLGLESIPAQVKEMTDSEALLYQLETTVCRVETKPVFIARRIERLLRDNPTWTLNEVAVRLHKSPPWIKSRLELLDLTPELQQLVDDGEMSLGNASQLAKLPLKMQNAFKDDALSMPTAEFQMLAGPIVKEYRERVLSKKMTAGDGHLSTIVRRIPDIRSEIVSPTFAGVIVELDGCETLIDAWISALKWVLKQDPVSLQTRQARHAKYRRLQIQQKTEAEREADAHLGNN